MESRNATFIETPPHLIAQPTRPSPLRELPSVELDNDYASCNDLLRDALDYKAVLNFNANISSLILKSVNGGPEVEQPLRQIGDVTRKDLLTSALHVAGNSTFSFRAKHVTLRYFFMQDIVKG